MSAFAPDRFLISDRLELVQFNGTFLAVLRFVQGYSQRVFTGIIAAFEFNLCRSADPVVHSVGGTVFNSVGEIEPEFFSCGCLV